MRGFLIILVIAALPLFGGGPNESESNEVKAPWEWTVDERLAARFDPTFAPKRAPGSVKTDIASGGPKDRSVVVSGEDAPELFLPIELFIALSNGIEGDGVFKKTSRATLRDRILDFGFDDEEFWRDLERVAADHLSLADRQSGIQRRLETADIVERRELQGEAEQMDVNLCRSRAVALAKAREHFGEERFDRFLYTVVGNWPLPRCLGLYVLEYGGPESSFIVVGNGVVQRYQRGVSPRQDRSGLERDTRFGAGSGKPADLRWNGRWRVRVRPE